MVLHAAPGAHLMLSLLQLVPLLLLYVEQAELERAGVESGARWQPTGPRQRVTTCDGPGLLSPCSEVICAGTHAYGGHGTTVGSHQLRTT